MRLARHLCSGQALSDGLTTKIETIALLPGFGMAPEGHLS